MEGSRCGKQDVGKFGRSREWNWLCRGAGQRTDLVHEYVMRN